MYIVNLTCAVFSLDENHSLKYASHILMLGEIHVA